MTMHITTENAQQALTEALIAIEDRPGEVGVGQETDAKIWIWAIHLKGIVNIAVARWNALYGDRAEDDLWEDLKDVIAVATAAPIDKPLTILDDVPDMVTRVLSEETLDVTMSEWLKVTTNSLVTHMLDGLRVEGVDQTKETERRVHERCHEVIAYAAIMLAMLETEEEVNE